MSARCEMVQTATRATMGRGDFYCIAHSEWANDPRPYVTESGPPPACKTGRPLRIHPRPTGGSK